MAAPPTPAPRYRSSMYLPTSASNSIIPPSQVERVADDNGVVKVRSGQTVGETFFSALQASYQNLVYHPIALTLLLAAIVLLCPTPNDDESMLLVAARLLHERKESTTGVFKDIPGLISVILKLIAPYSHPIAYIILTLVPYMVKPSNRNLWLACILGVIFWIKHLSEWQIVVFTQLFYCFVMLRSPSHRTIIALIFVLTLFAPYLHAAMLAYEKTVSRTTPGTGNFKSTMTTSRTTKVG